MRQTGAALSRAQHRGAVLMACAEEGGGVPIPIHGTANLARHTLIP